MNKNDLERIVNEFLISLGFATRELTTKERLIMIEILLEKVKTTVDLLRIQEEN